MERKVVDYSWARPDPAGIKAAGYEGVIRYLATDDRANAGKILRPDERDRLFAADLKIGLVWETTASRAGEGFDAGVMDAQRANSMADQLGWPSTRPIYYAVDYDASWGQVSPYFAGVLSQRLRQAGVYGSYRIIEGAAGMTGWLWQCAAWSGNGAGSGGVSVDGRRLSRHARLYQRVGYVLDNTCDENIVLADDWGGWHPDAEDDDMPSQEYFDQKFNEVQHGIATARDALQWGIVAATVKLSQILGHDPDENDTQLIADAVADEIARRLDQ